MHTYSSVICVVFLSQVLHKESGYLLVSFAIFYVAFVTNYQTFSILANSADCLLAYEYSV